MLAAASLELKAEQQDAHGNFVNSVAFSPDGKTIVSGSEDQTIKVWDAGVSALTTQTLSPNLTASVLVAASLELKAEKQGAHSDLMRSVAFSPDGKTIVSGSYQTLKVWDAAAADKRRPAERPAETSEVLEAIYPPSPLLSASYPPPSSPTSA